MSLVTRFRDGLMSKALFGKISDLLAGPNVWPTKQTMPASAAGGAGFRLPHGAAPGAPADGDVWSTNLGWFVRVNGVTYQLVTFNAAGDMVLKQGANPLPVTEGAIAWDIDDDVIVLGDSVGQKIFAPLPANFAVGDLVYAADSKHFARLAIGADGQVLTVAGGVPAWADRVTLSAAQVATGPAVDFIGIPAWAKLIVLGFNGVSLSGTDRLLVQIGDSGGIETTGYDASCWRSDNAFDNRSDSFPLQTNGSGNVVKATMTLVKGDGNTWVSSHGGAVPGTGNLLGGGDKTLSDVLTQVRVTRSGSNTLDAGKITATLFG